MQNSSAKAITQRSQNLLRICRQFSALNNDNDLVQGFLERIIKENTWISQYLPQDLNSDERIVWRQDSDAVDEALHGILEDLKVRGKYTKMFVLRGKIGVDEVGYFPFSS